MVQPEDVALTELMPAHVMLLGNWLHRPHVKPWYPDPEANIQWAVDPPAGASQVLIEFQGKPIGYLRWQRVDRATLDSLGLTRIPENSVDADILIGEQAYTARGIGPLVLERPVARLRSEGDVPLVGLTTSVDNQSAQKAFLKAEFTRAAEYSPPGLGRCLLFARSLSEPE
jgi:aminoglycoside 6'-N-acetyltransferase